MQRIISARVVTLNGVYTSSKRRNHMTYKTIIVAVDNDTTSEQVCECAHALAQACDATITLIHVIEPLYPVAMPGAIGVVPVSPGPTDEEHQQRIKESGEQIAALKEKLGVRAVDYRVIESAWTREAIHNVVHEVDADLIVVGSHGRHGLSLFFDRSTARELLKDAPCDLLAVRIDQ
jgi:universal stress protein A